MRIVILTGAGISAESGLGTFRDKGGLWSQYDLEDVATPEIETEAIDPASLRGGAANPPPATETSGSRLAEAWKD